ncbi:putative respiratory burst oxidase homolog protein J [Triticum dicoccoides]|nr:putative respiratory burst oxidase homolog protein J [Triticum dicoccoides]
MEGGWDKAMWLSCGGEGVAAVQALRRDYGNGGGRDPSGGWQAMATHGARLQVTVDIVGWTYWRRDQEGGDDQGGKDKWEDRTQTSTGDADSLLVDILSSGDVYSVSLLLDILLSSSGGEAEALLLDILYSGGEAATRALSSVEIPTLSRPNAVEAVLLEEFRTFKDKSKAINKSTGVSKRLTDMIMNCRFPEQKIAVGKLEYKRIIEERLVNEQIAATASALFHCDSVEKKYSGALRRAGDLIKDVSGINCEGWTLLKIATALKMIWWPEFGDSCEVSEDDVSRCSVVTVKMGSHFVDGSSEGREGWKDVERRFDEMNKAGRIPKESFGKCIGMGDMEEFVAELLVAMSRRWHIDPDEGVNKDQLKELWEEVTNRNFDSRLRIFFDICDKNGDGKLTEDEVKEAIILSASANKLKIDAAAYAPLVMEELDPDHRGYIEMSQLETLLRGAVSARAPEDEVQLERRSRLVRSMTACGNWMHLIVPVLLSACQGIIRKVRWNNEQMKFQKEMCFVLACISHGVSSTSGMHLFIKCNEVSTSEWHPFPITSAPGDGNLNVHIRAVGNGDWASQLLNIFAKPTVFIDGPYGAPGQNYKKYDIFLFIGLGFSVTAFISVLIDIMNNVYPTDEVESTRGSEVKNNWPERAYFYWVTGEQESFDWFKGIMNDVVYLDRSNVIEMYNYLTSVYEEGDPRSAMISVLQSLQHAKTGVDVISGSEIWTHFARPNWRMVFSRLANAHKNSRIGVFYCGTPTLMEQLKDLSAEFSQTTTTRFHFHNESSTII